MQTPIGGRGLILLMDTLTVTKGFVIDPVSCSSRNPMGYASADTVPQSSACPLNNVFAAVRRLGALYGTRN